MKQEIRKQQRDYRYDIDWTTFAPANGRVAGLRLRNHQADLVFCATLLGSAHVVLFVIEHKSSPDGGLHWQVLRYSVHLAHRSTRHGDMGPALVVPLVLAHGGMDGSQAWRRDLAPEVAADFAPLQPHIGMVVDDLAAGSESELLERPLPPILILTFLFLQHTRGRPVAELLTCLDRWGDVLRAVEQDAGAMAPHEALDELGWYLVDTTDLTETDVRMAFDKHLQQPEQTRMTTGQRIRLESRRLGREEGKLEGKLEGLTEARQQTLLRQLQRRFGALPPDAAARVLAAGPADLDRWLDRILEATTVDDVFAID